MLRRVARKVLARIRPARLAVASVALVLRGKAAPLRLIRVMRTLDPRSDALIPRFSSSAPTGSSLSHPILAKLLADREFGHWALSIDVVELIRKEIALSRPSLVLEFGSGSSTVAIAQFMRDLHGPDSSLRVISIEQDMRFVADTTSLLDRAGLAQHVQIVHAPLKRQVIEGVETICYDIPEGLALLAGETGADLVVIDGPAAESGARFGTLPLARHSIAVDAVFLLDDALRDSEIGTATAWAGLPYMRLDGVILVGKGVLRGRIRGAHGGPLGR